MYCSFASIGHADMMWSIFLSNCVQSLHLLTVAVLLLLLLCLSDASPLRVTKCIVTQFCTVNLPGLLPNSHISGFPPAISNSILAVQCVPLTKSCTAIFFATKRLAFPTFSANFPFCCFVCCAPWSSYAFLT